MYFYFCSDFPSVIKLSGIYYGKLENCTKKINIDCDPPFVEICPLDPSERLFSFFPDSTFLSSPPNGVNVVDLKGGFLLRFIKNPPFSKEFKVIEQKKFSDLVVTIFNENGLKISIETRESFFADTSNFSTTSAKIERFNLNGQDCVAIVLEGECSLLIVYSLDANIKKIFSREITSASFDNGLTTTCEFKDILKHRVVSNWSFSNGKLQEASREVTAKKPFISTSFSVNVIPFIFLEELLVGGDVVPFLSNEIKENADKLNGFFGDFIGIIPPPIFRDINEVGLIYPNGENKYKTEYFSFDLKNNLIFNIKKAD